MGFAVLVLSAVIGYHDKRWLQFVDGFAPVVGKKQCQVSARHLVQSSRKEMVGFFLEGH